MAITKLVISGADSKTISLAHKAEATSVVPDDNITATNVQSALEQLDDIKAPKASPTFTGTVTASSLAVDTDTLYVDVTNDRVGIGTTNPATALDVTGTITCDSFNVSDGTETTSIPATADRISFSGATFNYIQSSTNLQVQPQGDLVLYGTGSEIMRLKSGKVGIGTTNPLADLHVSNGTNSDSTPVEFMIGGTSNSVRTGSIVKGTTSGAYDLTLQTSNHATQNQPLIIKLSDATEAMRIDSSGNVGIAGGDLILRSDSNDADTQSIRFENAGDDSRSAYIRADYDTNSSGNATSLVFGTNPSTNDGSDRMRIESSGKVLIGKSESTFGNSADYDGHAISKDAFHHQSNERSCAAFNRRGNSGAIVDLYQDNAFVGNIGVESNGRPYFANSVSDGLKISNDSVAPCNGTGGNKDNAIDLGYSSNRWKDLYLSGGVHLGGTGSANKLDDYEEGTWTPAVIGTVSGSAASNAQQANYTKIGNVVYFQCYLQAVRFDIHNIVGEVNIDGLPFAPDTFGMVQIGYTSMTIYDETQYQISGYTSNNQSRVILRRGSSNLALNHTHLSPNVTNIMVSGVYTTNA